MVSGFSLRVVWYRNQNGAVAGKTKFKFPLSAKAQWLTILQMLYLSHVLFCPWCKQPETVHAPVTFGHPAGRGKVTKGNIQG